ncbi:MAG: polyprenyl synthetase family protein [Phycisphaerales bacterium]|nr:polyprenyl synthetase family protein [Phycisphaerales bacterium]
MANPADTPHEMLALMDKAGRLALAESGVVAAVAGGLDRVAERLSRHLRSDIPQVAELCRHVERYRGKMLRPTLVLLSGLAHGAHRPGDRPGVSDDAVTLAATLELIHLATLVHDDVLDEAEVRRTSPTVNSLRGNEVAVILGDYLIARSFHLCSTLDSQAIALRVGEVTGVVCEGEMLQLATRGDAGLTEKTYFDIIERKTGALIGVACELGARLAGADGETARRMYDFGVKLGVAFQIQDDLLDLTGEERVVGKSVGRDLDKGKMTLPLIHHLRQASASGRAELVEMVRGTSKLNGHRPEFLATVERTGSIGYARRVAEGLVGESKALLAHTPEGPARECLSVLAEAVVARSY